jgi:large subunit ribosomal protein L6
VVIEPLPGVKISCPDETHIVVEGVDRQKVGQTAALIHDVKRPEPYGGKGIKYKGEVIIRKEGKRASGGKK